MDDHIKNTIDFYAHDYRNLIKTSEEDLKEILESFLEAINCTHECTSNCRREGCNCSCGNQHF